MGSLAGRDAHASLTWTRILGLLVLGVAGCSTQVQVANRITLRPEGEPDLVIKNDNLQAYVEIVPARCKALYEKEILVGRVILESHKNTQISFEYRWQWSDSDDFKAEVGGGADTWQKEWINAQDEKTIIGKAVAPGMVAGRFELRYKRY